MTTIKVALSTISATFLSCHAMIQLLVWAMLFDILTGLVVAWQQGTVSSQVSRKGMARKALILLGVAMAELVSEYIGLSVTMPWGGQWQLGAAVAAYYFIHECLSITENIVMAGVPVPPMLRRKLAELQQRLDEEAQK